MSAHFDSACSGKVRHLSRKDARKVARSKYPGSRLQAYECPHCGFWHNGHPPTAVMRGAEDRDTWSRKSRRPDGGRR